MKKVETAATREEKIKNLARRITTICAAFYDRATEEQKEQVWKKLDELENAMIAYRNHEVVWDSTLIDAVESIDKVKFKMKQIATFDSVMDKARELFAYIGTTNPGG